MLVLSWIMMVTSCTPVDLKNSKPSFKRTQDADPVVETIYDKAKDPLTDQIITAMYNHRKQKLDDYTNENNWGKLVNDSSLKGLQKQFKRSNIKDLIKDLDERIEKDKKACNEAIYRDYLENYELNMDSTVTLRRIN